jgi:hypothetical protein
MRYRSESDRQQDARFVYLCSLLFSGLGRGFSGMLLFALLDSLWLHLDLYSSCLYALLSGFQ